MPRFGAGNRPLTSHYSRALCALLLPLIGGVARGQSIRLPLEENAISNVASVRGCGSAATASASWLEPVTDSVLVIHVDALTADEWERMKPEVIARYKRLGKGVDFRIGFLKGTELSVSDSLSTIAKLNAALKVIDVTPSALKVDAPTLYSSLTSLLRPSIARGASVVVAGKYPWLDKKIEDYAIHYLSHAFLAQQLRVSFWDAGDNGGENPISTAVARLTGATTIDLSSRIAEVTWKQGTFTRGFRTCTGKVLDTDGKTLGEFPQVELAPGFMEPDIAHYAELVRLKAEARKGGDAKGLLDAALRINPGDTEAMRIGADLFERKDDPKAAAGYLKLLAGMDAENGTLELEYGHQLYLSNDFENAGKALLEARRLKVATAESSEELARIYAGRKDAKAAIDMADDSLARNPRNQNLLLLRANLSASLENWEGEADSLEKALALGGEFLDRRTALVGLYLDHGQPAKAAPHVDLQWQKLPSDAEIVSKWAGLLERLQRDDDAIILWRKVIATDAKRERAYDSLCKLLARKDEIAAVLTTAEAALEALPKSGPLHMWEVTALERQGKTYLARRTLARAAVGAEDTNLLTHWAEVEDRFGGTAVAAYVTLAKTLEARGDSTDRLTRILERGALVAVREGDQEHAGWFETQLVAGGGKSAGLTGKPRAVGETIMLPGGRDALAFIARGKAGSPPERFLVEYCRTVLEFTGQPNSPNAKLYTESMRGYFQKLAELLQQSESKDGHTVIDLSISDKTARRKTETVLSILGWKLRNANKQSTVESGEKTSQSKRQEVATALAIDQSEMQEAFQAGKTFRIEIPMEEVRITLDEDTWKTFYPRTSDKGGFAEAVVGNPGMARAYVGVSALDAPTANALIESLGLTALTGQYSELLSKYSSSLALANGRVVVPGGTAAETAWTKLSGANPRDARSFLKALFTKDEGRLLRYFSTLSELDGRRQAFVTATPERLPRFYELFAQEEEGRKNTQDVTRVTFADFIRALPLNGDNTVDFPGSPEVWWVANGKSASTAKTAKLVEKSRRAAAPELEDEILVRMAKTHYRAANVRYSELDNFLAVVRIDEHRKSQPGAERLDDASAITLAQNYTQYSSLYPYFQVFTGMGRRDFELILTVGDHIRGLPPNELNHVMGQFHSALELLSLAVKADSISQKQAVEILSRFCESFSKAGGAAEYSAASLVMLRDLAALGPKGANADEAIRELILGAFEDVELESDGETKPMNAGRDRAAAFERVLDEQKVTPVQALLSMADAAATLAAGKGDPARQLKLLEESGARLIDVEVPKAVKGEGHERSNLKSAHPQKILNIVAQMRQKSAKSKGNLKDLEKLNGELFAELTAQIRIGMSGLVYAYYLSPDDLLVAEDPLLLRKHQFVDLGPAPHHDLLVESGLTPTNEKAGSYLVGGFATFGATAGEVAVSGAAKAGANGQAVFSAQIGTLRSTNWSQFKDSDQQVASLKIRIAREWIAMSAAQPKLREDLSEETLGLLSLARRRDLLAAIETRDWATVWESVTTGDLYFIGNRYLRRYEKSPWTSPVQEALRNSVAAGGRDHSQVLGGDLKYLNGGGHTHLGELPPYEVYERQLFPAKLAERAAEFKLYLADYFDRAAMPAQAMGLVAEPAARRLLRDLRMADLRDWNSVLAAYSKLDGKIIESVLTK